MDNQTSRTISWLRFVLVVMVLWFHVHPDANPNYLSMEHWTEGTAAQAVYTLLVTASFVICNLSVPLFFFISGYLFFTESSRWTWGGVWRDKMKRRVGTLLIPYLAYNLLSAANGYVMSALDPAFRVSWDNPEAVPFWGEFWNSTTACIGLKNLWGFSMQLYYPADIPLWFVRDLMLMVIASPAIYLLVKRCAAWWLTVVGILFICGAGATFPGFSTNALLFFSLGACFRIKAIPLLAFVRRCRVPGWLAGGILLLLSTGCYTKPYAQQLHHLFYIVGLFLLIGLGADAIDKGWGKVHPWLVRSSFFVFAAHMVPVGYGSLLTFSGQLAGWLFPLETIWGAVAAYLTAVCLIAAVGVGLSIVLQRYTPRLWKVLSGGR